jgi:hypothetical protein
MTGPSQFPKANIPRKLKMEISTARHPAKTQEKAKISAMIRRIHGNSAVRETPTAQLRFWGTKDCTHLSTATSPGK